MKLLCVDDVDENLNIYRKVLSKKFDVTTTQSSDEFIRLAKEQEWDFFIVDYRMPRLSGVEVLLTVNKPATRTFIVTADECVHCQLTRLKHFNFTLLMKPLDIHKLLSLMK